MRVIVIGAGVAGIATAQGLRRIGADVTLLERDPARRERGYQLNVLPNGRYALDRLGLLDALDREGRGWPLETGMMIDGTTGRRVQLQPQHSDHGRYRGASHYRSDVHRALLRGLDGGGPRYGSGVEGVVDPPDGPVRVRCSDGEELLADLVVAADGARSSLRADLFGPGYEYVERFMGVLAAVQVDLNGSSDAERMLREQARRHEFVQVMMPGRAVVLSMAAEGRLGLVLGGRLEDGRPQTGAAIRALAERYAEGIRDPRVHHAIECACWDLSDPDRAPGVWRIGDIDALPAYAKGRIALVGDAAHAMLPVLGQGANQSFEDALVLAERLRPLVGRESADSIRFALRGWSHARRAHVDPIRALARKILVGQLSESRLRYRLSCALMRRLSPAVANRQQNYVLDAAIADPECPIDALDERWLRWPRSSRGQRPFKDAMGRRLPKPAAPPAP